MISKEYPEGSASVLAGEIDELTAWQILHDVAADKSKTPISPENIMIDGIGFALSDVGNKPNPLFTAPESYDAVWALGASVFYIFLGCHVFQGQGGRSQRATTPIPMLRKELPELSQLIARCLEFNPKNRPVMAEIVTISESNIARCKACRSEFPPLKTKDDAPLPLDEIDKYWPEEMC